MLNDAQALGKAESMSLSTTGTGDIKAAVPQRVFLSHTSDLGKHAEPGSSAALVELARGAVEHDPRRGLRLLAAAEVVCPHLIARHQVALRSLRALLLLRGAAQTAAEQPAAAAAELGESARILLELDLPQTALRPVGAQADLLIGHQEAVVSGLRALDEHGPEVGLPETEPQPVDAQGGHREALGAALDVLDAIGPVIVRDCGPPGRWAVRRVALAAFASLLGGRVDPDDVLRASAHLKGARFATALRDVAALRARLAAGEPHDLLREIGDLQANLGTDLAVAEDASDSELFFERQPARTAWGPAAGGRRDDRRDFGRSRRTSRTRSS